MAAPAALDAQSLPLHVTTATLERMALYIVKPFALESMTQVGKLEQCPRKISTKPSRNGLGNYHERD